MVDVSFVGRAFYKLSAMITANVFTELYYLKTAMYTTKIFNQGYK